MMPVLITMVMEPVLTVLTLAMQGGFSVSQSFDC